MISFITSISIREKLKNIGIAEDLWKFPTTQKADVNAIVSTRLYTDPDRFCESYMDNHYSALELFIMLKTKYKILACGTAQDQNVLSLSESKTMGNLKMFYNPINGLLFGQWKDNKLV